MLEIMIPEQELFIEEENEFRYTKPTLLQLEHSLISIHKWESKWHKSFLNSNNKTYEELNDYIRCMTINKVSDLSVYKFIPSDKFKEIIDYIRNPMTAATFSNNDLIGASNNRREVITSETIYYWMIELNIPVEFERWHLEQLLALIKFINIKHQKPDKRRRNSADLAAERNRINRERRAALHSKG